MEHEDKYHFFGNFYLSPPECHLQPHALQRLRQLESHIHQLEESTFPGWQKQAENVLDLPSAFRKFQELESKSWAQFRRKDELVPPSGSSMWPIAHHLHNPSFQTLTPHDGETEDATSSCVWMILANNFEPGKTFIFDHLSRRESVDGLQVYPQTMLDLHESWLSQIRSKMAAKVEVIYGTKVRKRMSQIYNLEPLQLWGDYKDIVVYLEWSPTDDIARQSLIRFVVPAYHPQVFLSPGGARYGTLQDTILRIAHELAGLSYKDGFYKNFNSAMVNKSGIRPHHYRASKEFAIVAQRELNENIAQMMSRKLRPINRAQLPPDEEAIARFSKTKICRKYIMDPLKPSVINVRCKICSLPDKDYQPWCAKSGKYIARRKKCRYEKCAGRLAVPRDSSLEYVAYTGSAAPAKTASLTSSLCALVPDDAVRNHKAELTSAKRPFGNPMSLFSKPSAVQSTTRASTFGTPKIGKGYNSREFRQIAQLGEKGPFKYWHGRKPVISKMGRVRLWLLRDGQSAAMKIQRLDFSTYGPYLLQEGNRILEFNDRGISLVSTEKEELWHASLDQLRLRKNCHDLIELHRHELEQQRQ